MVLRPLLTSFHQHTPRLFAVFIRLAITRTRHHPDSPASIQNFNAAYKSVPPPSRTSLFKVASLCQGQVTSILSYMQQGFKGLHKTLPHMFSLLLLGDQIIVTYSFGCICRGIRFSLKLVPPPSGVQWK